MTALPIATSPPDPCPSPAVVAAASQRLRASGARLAPVRPLPRPRQLRPLIEVADVPDAIARDRKRWADCSRGAHVWVDVPNRPRICQHCPIPEDQAARVRAARRAQARRP